jgi:hypothetical protein
MAWFPKEFEEVKAHNTTRDVIDWCTFRAVLDGTNQISMDDVTFMIPYGTDSIPRFRNLCTVLLWLYCNTTAKIDVYISETEKGNSNAEWFKWPPKHAISTLPLKLDDVTIHEIKDLIWSNINNMFIPPAVLEASEELSSLNEHKKRFMNQLSVSMELRSDNEPFHRTKYLNEMLSRATTPIVINHDADVLLSTQTMSKAISILRNSEIDVVYPYGWGMNQLQIHDLDAEKNFPLILTGDASPHLRSVGIGSLLWSSRYGHSIFFRTTSYQTMHGENENFVSWGAEDVERYVRALKFGMDIARLEDDFVFHLEHPRGHDSSSTNPSFRKNEKLWEELQAYTTHELIDYYNNCDYYKKYGWGRISAT